MITALVTGGSLGFPECKWFLLVVGWSLMLPEHIHITAPRFWSFFFFFSFFWIDSQRNQGKGLGHIPRKPLWSLTGMV